MAASTIAALVALYKRLYVSRDLSNTALRNTPLFKKIPRIDDLYGNDTFIPLNYALPTGGTFGSFAKAQANTAASKVAGFTLTRKKFYHFVTLDMEAVFASKGKEGAFLSLKEKEANESVDYIGMLMGDAFWGDGSGALGQITAVDPGVGTTGITFTLQNRYDLVKIHIGQVLQGNPNRTGNAGTLRTDRYQVTGVQRQAGTFTADRLTGGTPNDWTGGEYIYVDGSYDAAFTGVGAFIPATTPGTLLGMSRADDPEAKGGWRGTWEGSIEESAKKLCAEMGPYVNKAASALWLSEYNWFRLEQELTAQNRKVMDPRAEATFGTPALVLLTPKGNVPVMADPYCPNDAGFLLDHGTWELHTMGKVPHIVEDEGLGMIRMTSEDSAEIRFRAWAEAVCTRPINNGRFPITA
jgi:hypothetical protein